MTSQEDEMKLTKFTLKLYVSHITVMLVSILFIGIFPSMAMNSPYLFSSITGLIYIITMYSAGWNFGKRDSRKIEGFMPDKKLPVKAAAFGLVVPIILLVMCYALPDIWKINIPLFTDGVDFILENNKVSGTTDFIYKLWSFPLEAFLGNKNIFRYVLVMLVQPVAAIAGYNVGLTKYEIFASLIGKVIFKKKIEQQNQKSPWNK